jgi:hypothetical protein
MEKKIKRKSKSRRNKSKHHTKISQKVIQKVIVNIAEHKKAKKARRKQKRKFQREAEDQQLQQPSSIPANVVYNTGGAYTPPPNFGATLIIPQPASVKKPQYVEVEEPSGIIDVPTKKEQLEGLFNPVPLPQDDIRASIYSEPVFVSKERVEGNYAFDKPDMYSERPPSQLSDNETAFQPRFTPQSLGAFLMKSNEAMETMSNITATKDVMVSAPKISKRRSTEEIAAARRDELYKLYLEGVGLSAEKSLRLVSDVENKDLPNEIKKAKQEIREMGKRIPK